MQKYLLRAYFKYADGRIWRSMWMRSSRHPSTRSNMQDMSGVIFAGVEAKNLDHKHKAIKPLIEIPIDEYKDFRWISQARIPAGGRGLFAGRTLGLILGSRFGDIEVYADGKMLDRRPK